MLGAGREKYDMSGCEVVREGLRAGCGYDEFKLHELGEQACINRSDPLRAAIHECYVSNGG